MQDDTDDDEFQTLYNNGHWEWSDVAKELIFKSDVPSVEAEFELFAPAPFKHGRVEFRDDIDLTEQQRYRKRFQRKSAGENDVVILQVVTENELINFHTKLTWLLISASASQDIKDLVLYTAPTRILNLIIIKILHLPSAERFIRALIFYCQYFIQTSDTMSNRLLEAESKVRTSKCFDVELELRENLEDIRLLVAKEYSNFILGVKEYNNFHHMGSDRSSKSLSKKEAFIFESFISISIQIIWIALGRKAYNEIELEVHRIFKSEKYNIVEHRLQTKYKTTFSPEEKCVLLGHCLQNKKKLYVKSPLMDELVCKRPIDFRLLGLGNVKYSCLTFRQLYLEQILTTSEASFKAKGLSLGILGLPRSTFDTMLMEIKYQNQTGASSSSSIASSRSITSSSMGKSRMTSKGTEKLYNDIVLPYNSSNKEWLPETFPTETPSSRACDQTQRKKWITRHKLQTKKYTSINKTKNKK